MKRHVQLFMVMIGFTETHQRTRVTKTPQLKSIDDAFKKDRFVFLLISDNRACGRYRFFCRICIFISRNSVFFMIGSRGDRLLMLKIRGVRRKNKKCCDDVHVDISMVMSTAYCPLFTVYCLLHYSLSVILDPEFVKDLRGDTQANA